MCLDSQNHQRSQRESVKCQGTAFEVTEHLDLALLTNETRHF